MLRIFVNIKVFIALEFLTILIIYDNLIINYDNWII